MALDAHSGQSAEAIARSATIARNTVADGGADVLGLVVNQARNFSIVAARREIMMGPRAHALLAQAQARSSAAMWNATEGRNSAQAACALHIIPPARTAAASAELVACSVLASDVGNPDAERTCWPAAGAPDTNQLPTLQLPADAPGRLLRELRDVLEPAGLRVFGGLPRDGVLQGVRLDAVAAALGTRFIAGQRDLLDASAAEVGPPPDQMAAVATACVGRPRAVTWSRCNISA